MLLSYANEDFTTGNLTLVIFLFADILRLLASNIHYFVTWPLIIFFI
jgi:hypothetical protein